MTQKYIVETASDGFEGMKQFNKQQFDLILLDVMMPSLNGFDVAKMIRTHSKVPIIMLTAMEEEQDQIKGFDHGADDYITKPFSFHVLIRRVESVLKRSYDQRKRNQFIFKEIQVDGDAYKVYVNKAEIPLRQRNLKFCTYYFKMEKKY